MLPRRAVLLGSLLLLAIASGGNRPVVASARSEIAVQIRFGAEMAREGNWREAIFRWERALKLAPDNPRLHNNLAVGWESLGEYAKAEAEYRLAVASPDSTAEIRENYALFSKFYEALLNKDKEPGAATSSGVPTGEPGVKRH